jgi:hypothetical protein
MIPSKIRVLLLCAALAACGDKRPTIAKMSDALPNLPLPPDASFVARSGGPDVIQVTVRTPAGVEAVTAYYRRILKTGGWKLVNDAKDKDGATVLLAEQKGPPLWVRIEQAEDGHGTLVQLSGAILSRTDSAVAKATS